MAFLAVFVLTLSLAADRVATRWQSDLSQSATVRLSSVVSEHPAKIDAVLAILGQTPGVASARVIDPEEQAALLAPWFGQGAQLEALRLPALIDVTLSGDGPDAQGLRQRFAAEVPEATYDDHGRWRAPLVEAAGRLKTIGWTSLLLISGVTATIIALAASSAFAANAQVVEVLRLVGATDGYITGAFVRRFAVRTLLGASIGTLVALIIVALLPGETGGGALSGLRLQGWQWLLPFLVPPAAAALSYGATRAAASRRLKEVS